MICLVHSKTSALIVSPVSEKLVRDGGFNL